MLFNPNTGLGALISNKQCLRERREVRIALHHQPGSRMGLGERRQTAAGVDEPRVSTSMAVLIASP
jgi:hypothetical protein